MPQRRRAADGRRAVIVAVAESDLAFQQDKTPIELMAQATDRALTECGLTRKDIDGLCSANPYYWMPSITLGEYLGIVPRFTDSTTIGGSSSIAHLEHAVLAIEAGYCDVALVAYGSNQASRKRGLVTLSEWLPGEFFYGPMFPISAYALVAQRHMHAYGTTSEQMAAVAVATRRWAQLNPKALVRDPLTVEDVLASPIVSSPLHRHDICLVTDGGGAFIVTTEERARDLRTKPIYVLGSAVSHQHRHISQMPDLTTTAGAITGPRAFAEAGLKPSDIDVVQIYDAFTISVIIALEDLGFCAKGEGGAFATVERLGPGGALPTNTSGGGLSYCHPGMFGIFLIIEAVRQLRGECGARQVPNAKTSIVHGIGGVYSGIATALLGRERP
jgi:acetyl-CoA acetyltransferase